MSQLSEMTEVVVEWIRPLLSDDERDPVNTCIKMSEEVAELMHALHTGDGNAGEECADIMVLLLDIAHLRGIDLFEEFWNKMDINRNRTWNKEKGCLKHEHSN